MARDIRTQRELEDLGWKVAVIWECGTKSPSEIHRQLTEIFGAAEPSGD